jgi:anti-sigma B factor antagonist
MKIGVQKLDREVLIKLSGKLDMNTSPDLRKAALAACIRGKCNTLTVDLGEVPFIDTSGLATLLDILVATKQQHAELILSGLNEKVRFFIDVNDLTEFFRIVPSAEGRLHL